MDEQQPNLEARLRAMEFLIANLYGIEKMGGGVGMLIGLRKSTASCLIACVKVMRARGTHMIQPHMRRTALWNGCYPTFVRSHGRWPTPGLLLHLKMAIGSDR
jgi:hypothetical protein